MSFLGVDMAECQETCDAKKDLYRFDSDNLWGVIYERLKNRSTLLNKEVSCNAARAIHNRWKNRYRDISPYDDTRVFLHSTFDGDYINASYVGIPTVPTRKYILTQGPMQQTASHFWLMVWECRSPTIIMLNRIFERGVMRCFPYFPHLGGPTLLTFNDVDLRVRLEQESDMQLFVKRSYEITHLHTDERHHLIHMHYTNWPDFGVPVSPSGMLNFLWAVRATGTLADPEHPAIVHCSAGVGRSGAFVLIDLALYLVELRGSLNGLDLSQLFLDLRRCRMGIIQTADQLRFCYCAIVRGAEELIRTPAEEIPYIKFEPDSEEVAQSIESSESDDGWEGLGEGEYDSSVDEFDRVEDEIDLEEIEDERIEDEEDEEKPFNQIPPIETRQRVLTNSLSSRFDQRNGAMPKNSWLPTEMNAVMQTSSIGVGPGSHETINLVMSRNDHRYASQREHLRRESFSEDLFTHSGLLDRSNNAIPNPMSTQSENIVSSRDPEPLQHFSGNTDSALVHDEPTLKPDGDSIQSVSGQSHVTEPSELQPAPQGNELDPITSDYLAATYDLIRRRELRRERQIRLRERIELTRQRMHDADLERKRWLPARISRFLCWFYTRSGFVQNRYEAIAFTAILVLSGVSLARIAYGYWFR